MVDPKLKDLITRDVDGLLPDAEKSQLERSLRRNKEARAAHAAHRVVSATLATVREAEPPVHLAHRIRHAAHAGDPSPSSVPRPGFSLAGVFRSRAALRYAGVFAGGLVAGVLFFVLLMQPEATDTVDTSAAGSLVPRTEFIPVNAGNVAGSVTVARRPGVNEVSLRLTVPPGVVTRLDFDPSRVAVESLRGVETADGSLVVRNGRVELTGSTRQLCTVVLVPGGAGGTVAFSLRSDDIEFFRRPITLTR